MSFFGMGPMELTIIVVVALLIFGPGKLPEVAGQVGRAVRDFRRMTSELTGEFEKTMSVADDVKKAVRAEVTSMTKEVTSVADSVKRDLSDATGDLKTATGGTNAATATAKNETKSVKAKSTRETKVAVPKTVAVASKADPLADVSIMDDDVPAVKTNGHKPAPVPAAKTAVAPAPVATVAAPVAKPTPAAPPREENRVETLVNGSTNEPVGDELAAAAASNGGVPGDALARARQRRQSAGYNRRLP